MSLRSFFFTALLEAAVALNAYAQTPNKTPGFTTQGPDHYSFMVGAVKVTALSDGTVPQDLHALLRNTTNEKTDALLRRSFLSNPVEASINAFFFRTGDRLVLVDTGAGQFFGSGFGGKLLLGLVSIGLTPDKVTDVLLTHAHDDHMGGLVHDGKLTFPNAIVHLSNADLRFFMDRANSKRTGYDISYFDQAFTVLDPYLKSGKVKTFTGAAEVLPGVTAEPHPGHTPGSTFYTLRNHGQDIVFIGDIIHVGAVQAPNPEITIAYDVNPAMASSVRQEAFSSFADHGTLVAVPHLPFPGVGHLRRREKGFEWVPVEYGNRDPGPDDNFANRHAKSEKHE